jgi:hypothetical protein
MLVVLAVVGGWSKWLVGPMVMIIVIMTTTMMMTTTTTTLNSEWLLYSVASSGPSNSEYSQRRASLLPEASTATGIGLYSYNHS